MANLEFRDSHNMVAYLKKTEGSERFHQIVDFLNTSHIQYALTENLTIYVSLIQQFWRHLKLEDFDGISHFSTTEIFEQLALMGRHLKLEDYDGISNFSTTGIFEQLALMGSKKNGWEQFSSNIATAIICLATNRKFNFSKLIFDGMGEGSTVLVESHHTPTGAPSTSQPHLLPTLRSSIRQEIKVPQPNSPPHTNVADGAASTGVDVRYGGAATTVTGLKAGQGSGRMQHNELMDLVTKLSDRVVALETDLTQTKKVYGAAFTKFIKKVKRLEKKDKLSKSRRKLRLVLLYEEGSDSDILAQEDPSKQGKKIAQIDEDKGITLVQIGVSTASIDLPLLILVYIRRSATKTKDKGKGIMEESESAMIKTKGQQEQERLGYEAALRLQEQLDEEERQRIARAHEATSSFNIEEWEDIQARIEADEELAQSYTLHQLRGYSFDEIKSLSEAKMKRVNTFTPMKSDVDRIVPKIAAGSTKRAQKKNLDNKVLRSKSQMSYHKKSYSN
ncbi:hypothetical protein Tco_1246058 [Tanacetum coccineum]